MDNNRVAEVQVQWAPLLICCDMLATEQQIVEGVKTVPFCAKLDTGQNICGEGRRKNDGELVSYLGSLVSGHNVQGDSINQAIDPNVENQNTDEINTP